MDKITLPDLDLCIVYQCAAYTIGRVRVEGIYICDFLVPTDKIVPCGIYSYTLYRSPRNGIVPLLVDVAGRSMIEVHVGNKPSDSRGCFLVGYNQSKGLVSSSKIAMDVLRRNVVPSDWCLYPSNRFVGKFKLMR